ncbi:Uma2 family endonuclease [Tundrisphaera lichenicola]|uniref:Uma2 family endonuclease n=1 Tax=Tundrisphaera lichenicola TaxID=2029860 RepID=UPI003EBA2264
MVRKLKARAERSPSAFRDEVWDGIYVMSPLANIEHQIIGQKLWMVFEETLPFAGGGLAINGFDLSDRVEGWKANDREPDVGVYLAGNPARNCDTHFCGGPNLAVEILSPNDLARRKLDFYAKVNTKELLIVDRQPWALELYRLIDGFLILIGASTPQNSTLLTSQALPLTFRLVPGESRPTIEIVRADGGQTWRI